jgi:hypothetical protein
MALLKRSDAKMSSQAVKSRPFYRPIGVDATGARHLLVSDAAEPPSEALCAELGLFDEVWTVTSDARSPSSPFMAAIARQERHSFRSRALILDALDRRLARETMGFRLYAVGSETFLADVRARGAAAGLSLSEMTFAHAGSLARRVYCVHCRTLTDGVTDSIFTCAGCNSALLVRDHFSARMAAYMGVQIDAEAPGEVPPAERLYP